MVTLGVLLATTMMRIDISDPFQAYNFECALRRPSGETLALTGNVQGRSDEARTAAVVGAAEVPSGTNLPVRIVRNEAGVTDREIFSIELGDVHYAFIIDRSIPFENGAVGFTVVGMNPAAADPVMLSALGFCTVDESEEGSIQ